MKRVLDLIRRVAKVDSSVVFEGERGSGKERLARLVHAASARASAPFVSVSCANVPERLLESELFGHARGAFPGASGERAGLFEAARGGTLLIEDVTEMPSALQAKLVRALDDRKVRRMGEIASRAFDVRVIAAATRKLADAVNGGRFRRDLAERLGVMTISVPPLRDRKEDVLPLARQMLARAAARVRREDLVLAPASVDALLLYPWPGNERELENAIERAAAATPSPTIEPISLPEEVRLGKPTRRAGSTASARSRTSRRSTSSPRSLTTTAIKRAPPTSSGSERRRSTESSRRTACRSRASPLRLLRRRPTCVRLRTRWPRPASPKPSPLSPPREFPPRPCPVHCARSCPTRTSGRFFSSGGRRVTLASCPFRACPS